MVIFIQKELAATICEHEKYLVFYFGYFKRKIKISSVTSILADFDKHPVKY